MILNQRNFCWFVERLDLSRWWEWSVVSVAQMSVNVAHQICLDFNFVCLSLESLRNSWNVKVKAILFPSKIECAFEFLFLVWFSIDENQKSNRRITWSFDCSSVRSLTCYRHRSWFIEIEMNETRKKSSAELKSSWFDKFQTTNKHQMNWRRAH